MNLSCSVYCARLDWLQQTGDAALLLEDNAWLHEIDLQFVSGIRVRSYNEQQPGNQLGTKLGNRNEQLQNAESTTSN